MADVVGLGKTYIGAELLRQLRQSYPNDGPPLIICTAGLVDTWRQVNEHYGLGAEVLSQSRISPPPDLVFDPETEQYEEIAGSAHGVYPIDGCYRARLNRRGGHTSVSGLVGAGAAECSGSPTAAQRFPSSLPRSGGKLLATQGSRDAVRVSSLTTCNPNCAKLGRCPQLATTISRTPTRVVESARNPQGKASTPAKRP